MAGGLRSATLQDLDCEDEAAFRPIGLYALLKQVLRKADYRFQLMPKTAPRWGHALVLNLGFWRPTGGGDVLVDEVVPADVICHIAWHQLAGAHLADGELPLAAEALLLGEAIASAFDLYLVGRLMDRAPECGFIATQLPALADAAELAGVDADAFAKLLDGVRADPEAAFESLRQLLYQTSVGLLAATDADAALAVLLRADDHRFGCLLHHYEIANWLQHARAAPVNGSAQAARTADADLMAAPVALDWLERRWIGR